jgi:hypothetical protein
LQIAKHSGAFDRFREYRGEKADFDARNLATGAVAPTGITLSAQLSFARD